MIAVIDYGMGNLRSVRIGVERAGGEAAFARSPGDLEGCSGLLLPGVGAFGRGMENLARQGLVEPLREWAAGDRPLLAICLGLQLLFDGSEEQGRHEGLGILGGRVVRFPGDLKVPQLGWNDVALAPAAGSSPYSEALADGACYYFAHSYHAAPDDDGVVIAATEYGLRYASVVGRGRLVATQFHPEKSGDDGLRFLRRFVEVAKEE